jgi:hypothetical protein
MNTPPRFFFIAIIGALISSCASSGTGRLSSTPAKTVFIRPGTSDRVAEYVPELASQLRSAGFSVVSTPSATYEVALNLNSGGTDLSCSIVMYERGVPVVSGRASNIGFGTWLARGAAYQQVFSAALRQFSKRIGAM